MRDKHARSIAKAVSWRIMATIITSTLVFLFTGLWALSLTIGAVEFLLKTVVFYIHERAWFMIRWGRDD
jgi:adenylylsulfate kinase